jgi:hypothetical protein
LAAAAAASRRRQLRSWNPLSSGANAALNKGHLAKVNAIRKDRKSLRGGLHGDI